MSVEQPNDHIRPVGGLDSQRRHTQGVWDSQPAERQSDTSKRVQIQRQPTLHCVAAGGEHQQHCDHSADSLVQRQHQRPGRSSSKRARLCEDQGDERLSEEPGLCGEQERRTVRPQPEQLDDEQKLSEQPGHKFHVSRQ